MRYMGLLLISLFLCGLAYAHPIDMKKLARIESSNNPSAVSPKGAIGLYQIMPIVLKHFNETVPLKSCVGNSPNGCLTTKYYTPDDLLTSGVNEIVADWYLDWLWARIPLDDENEMIANLLIAWNWGPGNWRKWYREGAKHKKLPKETQDFLKKYFPERGFQ